MRIQRAILVLVALLTTSGISFAATGHHPSDQQTIQGGGESSIEADSVLFAVGGPIEKPSTIVYVDDSNTTGIEDGSMAHPFNTIGEGMNAASPGEGSLEFKGSCLKSGDAMDRTALPCPAKQQIASGEA